MHKGTRGIITSKMDVNIKEDNALKEIPDNKKIEIMLEKKMLQ